MFLLPWLVAAVFIHAGWLNVSGPSFIQEEFNRWGFPSWFRLAVGWLEVAGAVLLMFEASRFVGSVILIVIMLGVCFTIVRHADWHNLSFPLVLLALSAYITAINIPESL